MITVWHQENKYKFVDYKCKPLGIIDDQVMSNTSWKACFHVNNVQDSREILQNEKAYTLKNPGDMVLQTKNESLECKSFYLQRHI